MSDIMTLYLISFSLRIFSCNSLWSVCVPVPVERQKECEEMVCACDREWSCVCVLERKCVWLSDRERESAGERMRACVCQWKRERERESDREHIRQGDHAADSSHLSPSTSLSAQTYRPSLPSCRESVVWQGWIYTSWQAADTCICSHWTDKTIPPATSCCVHNTATTAYPNAYPF